MDAIEVLLGHGVKVHCVARYHLGAPTREGLVFGYGASTGDPSGMGPLRKLLQR